MSNVIIRPLATDLGFDEYGQLWCRWSEDGRESATIVFDMRGKVCCICGRPWEVNALSFKNQMRGSLPEQWCHKTCWTGHLAVSEAATLDGILLNVFGRTDITWSWTTIPNEYGGGWNTPWYCVWFKHYVPRLKFGSRKRVVYMEMFDLRPEQVGAFLPLVASEEVTKGAEVNRVYIHAWTDEKALEYMKHFLTLLKMDKPLADPRA